MNALARLGALVCVLLLLTMASGCMIVQTRFSVFGFDGMQTDSPQEAQRRSLLLLGGVAAGSALFGAAAFWLGRMLVIRLRQHPADDSSEPCSGEHQLQMAETLASQDR